MVEKRIVTRGKGGEVLKTVEHHNLDAEKRENQINFRFGFAVGATIMPQTGSRVVGTPIARPIFSRSNAKPIARLHEKLTRAILNPFRVPILSLLPSAAQPF